MTQQPAGPNSNLHSSQTIGAPGAVVAQAAAWCAGNGNGAAAALPTAPGFRTTAAATAAMTAASLLPVVITGLLLLVPAFPCLRSCAKWPRPGGRVRQ
uniref:Melanogenic peroxidase n=1 Tax=Streptomyces sp. KCTC 11604BP TaxID=941587 RepID=E9KTJ4_9ACTN|nr:melanogenic peroxidase [Streptomyces sp. KCTC 11604BP]